MNKDDSDIKGKDKVKKPFGTKKPAAKNNKRKEIKPPKKISERYLYNSGLAYLQRFPASSMHFKFIMTRKINKSCRHHTEQNFEDCIQMLDDLTLKFQDSGLLDDDAYLKGMITSLRRRGLSALQIYNKLQQKGYQRDTVEKTLKEHDIYEHEVAEQGDIHAAFIFARKKRLGPFDVMQKKEFDKSLSSMARAGYSYEVAKRTLETAKEDLPDEFQF